VHSLPCGRKHDGMVYRDIGMAKRYGHIGSHALREAADVLGRVDIPPGYPKKSPKSEEGELAAVQ
jgi:hypothetical protein